MTIFPKNGSTSSENTLSLQTLGEQWVKLGNPWLSLFDIVEKLNLHSQAGDIARIITEKPLDFEERNNNGITQYRLKQLERFINPLSTSC